MQKKNLFSFFVFIFFSLSLVWTLISFYHTVSTIAPDFSVLWHAAKDLTIGINPYTDTNLFTGVGYPVNTLLFYLPLTFLSYKFAQLIFVSLILISIPLCLFLSLKIIDGNKTKWIFLLVLTSLALISFPTKFTIGMGQNNTITLLTLLFSFYQYKQRNYYLSGFFLGLSTTFKTVFGFLLLFFLLKKEWKILASALLTIAFSILLIYILFPSAIDLYKFYLSTVVPDLLNLQGREIYYNQGILGFVSRSFQGLFLRKYITLIFSFILTIFVMIKTLDKKYPSEIQFSGYITGLLLVDSLSWQHHFVWLIFPFILLTSRLLKEKNKNLLILTIFSYLLVSWNFKNPSKFSVFPSNLLLSHAFYGTFILFLINLLFLLSRKYRDTIKGWGIFGTH